MFRPTQPVAERKGVVLLVVLTMLMLFAIVGVSFVVYASAEARTNQLQLATPNQANFDIEPDLLFSMALGQIIYDVPDDTRGAYSALRGHSLARNAYGYNDAASALNNDPYSGPGRLHLPTTGYFGAASPTPYTVPAASANAQSDAYLVNYTMFYDPNNPIPTYAEILPVRDPEHLGARPTMSAVAATLGNPNLTVDQYVNYLAARTPFLAANPTYTYADHNSMFLAAVKSPDINTTTGLPTGAPTVISPSYHREWLFGRLDMNPNNPAGVAANTLNPNWTNLEGRYLSLRPRPIDNVVNGVSAFPYPSDRGGDVKNLVWATGGNDSIWTDVGAPVMTGPDGRRFKILVAPLIMDLDSKLNVTVAGNIMNGINSATPHASNQGWGPWEMNLAKVLNAAGAPNEYVTEYIQSFVGKANPAISVNSNPPPAVVSPGKYGVGTAPAFTVAYPFQALPSGQGYYSVPHAYAAVNYNGTATGLPVLSPTIQTVMGTSVYPTSPNFSVGTAGGYGNAAPGELYANANAANPTPYHAGGYNPFGAQVGANKSNRIPPMADLVALLRTSDTGTDALTANLLQLLPSNFISNNPSAVRRRAMLTPYSYSNNRPAMQATLWDPLNQLGTYTNQVYQVNYPTVPTNNVATNYPALFPSGSPFQFPTPPVLVNNQNAPPNAPPTSSDFDQTTWRSAVAKLGKIDLNRPLTAYMNFNGSFQHQAELDRQNLAKDIFNRLCVVTGAKSPFLLGTQIAPVLSKTYPTYDPQFEASRYLAQLAANIVDFIDSDEVLAPPAGSYNLGTYHTVFVWNPINPAVPDPWNDTSPNITATSNNFVAPNATLVFGTEPPKLVLNEVYGQFDNDWNDLKNQNAKGVGLGLIKANGYNVNMWVELLNPFADESGTTGYDNTAYLVDPNTKNPIYQILLTDPIPATMPAGTSIMTPDNVLGDPFYLDSTQTPAVNVNLAIRNGANPLFDPTATAAVTQIKPVNNAYGNGTNANNPGFSVVGPPPFPVLPAGLPFQPDPGFLKTYSSAALNYVPPGGNGAKPAANVPVVLLRRLVYPSQPPNPALPASQGGIYNPNIGPYNPYITVDYVDQLKQNAMGFWENEYFNGIGQKGKNGNGNAPTPMALRSTIGRMQPYDATYVAQAPPPVPLPNTPVNTFFMHNSPLNAMGNPPTASTATLTLPFNWLPHLDRQLISPVELLQVSAHKPHELTHTFVQYPNNTWTPNSQRAAWLDDTSRLYRFFEMVETQSRLPGSAVGGRLPGKININTLQDLEVFQAMCDAQLGNGFYGTTATPDTYVTQAFQNMINKRSSTAIQTQTANVDLVNHPTSPVMALGQFDRPIKSLGVGPSPGGVGDALDPTSIPAIQALLPALNPPTSPQWWPIPRGVNETIFASPGNTNTTTNNTPWQPTVATLMPSDPSWASTSSQAATTLPSPYFQNELLTKIYNNVSTHSDTFAVFLTIGFFEVVDETTRPVKLGAEINAAQGTNIRHRMVAIVDRTNLEVFGQPASSPVATTTTFDTSTFSAPGNLPEYPYEFPLVEYDAMGNQILSTLNMVTGTNQNTGKAWTIQAGMVLVFEPGTANEESVTVYSKALPAPLTGTGLFAMFRRPHPYVSPTSVPIISRGNPGPWSAYSQRNDPTVVPFFAIIN